MTFGSAITAAASGNKWPVAIWPLGDSKKGIPSGSGMTTTLQQFFFFQYSVFDSFSSKF